MSRSYAVLAAAMVGVAGLAGVAGLTNVDDTAAVAPSSGTSPVVDTVVDTMVDTVVDTMVDTVVDAELDTTPRSGSGASTVDAGPVSSDAAVTDQDPLQDAVVPGVATGDAPSSPVDAGTCTLTKRLEVDATDPEVACLEAHLALAGLFPDATPDDLFDPSTDAAVKAFQGANGLVVDGVVGPQTAEQLGAWSGPDVLPPDASTCPTSGRSAVIDRFNQRAWLCDDGAITDQMPITSAVSQPDPGTYDVYAKDIEASSTLTGEFSTMTHFVAFTRGKYQGARIAFHSIPKYANGEYVQPLDSVGTQQLFGDSSGCIRVLPDDAALIWDWLDIGDTVTVVT